ncbi:hypothetical protein AUC69_02515 [Methyloceanibacter superfactus]|uniref:biotin--[biotin carboxyl-carrier protein] ligase n=1 Tax=Methyloceanibacter superfactus TaxID=1774969 RepID=A0A1E3VPI0_9HYPH|nr:biotin--[acetyl-CoA-carboxylase] ligase [Methyloceanibacter superfactus]ODR95402.1 hypothetical protein AUC69_02515 [Methyloceanibacter superfactus]
MPAGYRLAKLDSVDSTNAEARRRADRGEPGPLWIWSSRQSKGRGRAGREWTSQFGNLFASLLIRLNCPLPTASQLALVAGIVAYETVAKLIAYEAARSFCSNGRTTFSSPRRRSPACCSRTCPGPNPTARSVVIGTGINLANHPENLPQPAVSLAEYGLSVTPGEALQVLAATTHEWLMRWGEGATFPTIRRAWLDRAGPVGRPMRVKLNGVETEGTYAGLDSDGALRLRTSEGEARVTAGDVFFAN